MAEDKPINFNYRFKVETNMGAEGVIDHRSQDGGFYTREYHRNTQKDSEPQEQLSGFPPMKSVTQPPKPRVTDKSATKAGTKQVTRKKKTTTDQDSALKQLTKRTSTLVTSNDHQST